MYPYNMRYPDFQGTQIRLTSERLAHILSEHPFMIGKEWTIADTLLEPDEVRTSNHDDQVSLYYRWYNSFEGNDKLIGVVRRILGSDAFVLTA